MEKACIVQRPLEDDDRRQGQKEIGKLATLDDDESRLEKAEVSIEKDTCDDDEPVSQYDAPEVDERVYPASNEEVIVGFADLIQYA